eukprot:scpid17601/ scgid24595/ Integrin alpha-8; Integrin alpha-8 heavy chain; Integrin alpha-8 light chain
MGGESMLPYLGLLLLLVCCATGQSAADLNLDVLNPLVFTSGSAEDSAFGYSVSFHRASGSTSVLVGAPNADIPQSAQFGINQTGAVYRCDATHGATCQQMAIDVTDNQRFNNPPTLAYYEEKSYMRLGSSLMTSGVDGVLVTCASSFHLGFQAFFPRPGFTQLWDVVGRCYILPADLNVANQVVYQPCKSDTLVANKRPTGGFFTELSMCLTGVNMDISPTFQNMADRSSLLVSASNFRDGVGTLINTGIGLQNGSLVDTSTEQTLPPYIFEMRNRPLFEQQLLRRSSQTAWASTQGDFNGDGLHELAFNKPLANPIYDGPDWAKFPVIFLVPVVGDDSIMRPSTQTFSFPHIVQPEPYLLGPGLEGTLINESVPDLKPYIRLPAQQRFEFFGFTMITYDTNNDGMDELYVAAPMYSVGLDGDETADVTNGRVYVYQQSLTAATNTVFAQNRPATAPRYMELAKPDRVLMTGQSEAQFGTSMARLGDLNKDGYNDVIIGAPYQTSGKGAIFLFLGSPTGLAQHQEITPSLLGEPGLASFGYSLSAGIDADSNTYNDVLVGAPNSNRVIALLTRPVLHLNVTMTMSSIADFSPAGACAPPNQALTCIPITVCFEPTSDRPITLPIVSRYTLSSVTMSAQRQPNLLFQPFMPGVRNVSRVAQLDSSITISSHTTPACATHNIYLETVLNRPCRQSQFSFTWQTDVPASTRTNLAHVVIENTQGPLVGNVTFVDDCPTCRPDLSLQLQAVGGLDRASDNTVFAGPGFPTTLTLTIENRGAVIGCNPNLTLHLDAPVSVDTGEGEILPCTSRAYPTAFTQCRPRRTLYPGRASRLTYILDGSNLTLESPTITLTSSIMSSNPMDEQAATLADNVRQLTLSVRSTASLVSLGGANPSSINVSSTSDAGRTDQAIHTHTVINLGPGHAPASSIEITYGLSVPGLQFATLENVQGTRRNIRCDYESGIESDITGIASNGTIAYRVERLTSSQSSAGSGSVCTTVCKMTCEIPALRSGESAGPRLIFKLQTGPLRNGGHLSSSLKFTSTSRVVSVKEVTGFTANLTTMNTMGSSTTKLAVVGGGEDGGINVLYIILPIVIVLLIILLVILILRHQGFFERGKHLEELMLTSSQAVMGAIGTSADGMYRKSVPPPAQNSENGGGNARTRDRPSLTRQESSI